jgi:hypothetical protein
MSVCFPLRPNTRVMGTPFPAISCDCDPPLLIDSDLGTCLHCGHLPRPVVDETWRQQARRMAGSQPVELIAA